VLDSTVYYGSVAGGSASWGAGTFTVTFDQSCANAQAVVLDLVLSDTTAAEWTSAVQPVVAAPVFEVTSYGMHDLLGDADWMAEPGETVIVTLEITNRGLAAGSPTASASSSDPMFAVTDSISSCGTVEAGGVGHSLHRVVISPACPGAYAGAIQVATASPGGYAFEDTVYLAVGELAFSDDCESGAGGWVREGSPDMWHLSTYRSHSGSTSWYFGDPGTHRYVSGADASLTTRGLVAGDRCKLSFWFWYEFTTYGVDGLYVIVTADGVPDTLDYIGSGGALNIWSRWVPWERDLDVTPGDSLALSFAFKSDGGDTAEGVYIDDMTLSVVTPGEAWVPPAVPEPGAAFRAYPNPAAGSLTFSFPSTRAAVMDVYDVRGRQVASLTKPAGASTLVWDIDAEQDIASGIYLAKVRNAGNDRAQKIVVVR